MSKSDVEFYTGRTDQRRALRDTLIDLHGVQASDQKIANLLRDYLEEGKVPRYPKAKNAPTRATIRRIRVATDGELDRAHTSTLGPLYNFLCVCEELPSKLYNRAVRIHSGHKLAPLLEALEQLVGATDGPLTNAKMKSLEGEYYLYRGCWTSPDIDAHIRSIIRFEWVGDAMFYTEEQTFHDTIEDLPVRELDTGLVFPFGLNVVLLGRGGDKDLLKFFSIDDFSTYPDGIQRVHTFSGNFIAVYGKGEHPGYKAYAKRVPAGETPECRFYAPGELDETIVNHLRKL